MFKDRIREERQKKGLSQKSLGEMFDVSQQAIQKWESGKGAPSNEALVKLAKFFNCSEEYLLGMTNKRTETIEDYLSNLKNKADSSSTSPDSMPPEITRLPPINTLKDYPDVFYQARQIAGTDLISLPIIGSVKAGPNGIAFEERLGNTLVNAHDIPNGLNSYCLMVRGDSMSPYLLPGDLVIFHENPDVQSGSLAIVIVDGEEGTVKWVERGENYICLKAENPYYPSREFRDVQLRDVRIVGPVTQITRKPNKKNGTIIRS